jgi:hypothetical protein
MVLSMVEIIYIYDSYIEGQEEIILRTFVDGSIETSSGASCG